MSHITRKGKTSNENQLFFFLFCCLFCCCWSDNDVMSLTKTRVGYAAHKWWALLLVSNLYWHLFFCFVVPVFQTTLVGLHDDVMSLTKTRGGHAARKWWLSYWCRIFYRRILLFLWLLSQFSNNLAKKEKKIVETNKGEKEDVSTLFWDILFFPPPTFSFFGCAAHYPTVRFW